MLDGKEYQDMKIQPLEVMTKTFTPEQMKGFLRGNILKYIMRMEKKGEELSDVKKALTYCSLLLEWENQHKGKSCEDCGTCSCDICKKNASKAELDNEYSEPCDSCIDEECFDGEEMYDLSELDIDEEKQLSDAGREQFFKAMTELFGEDEDKALYKVEKVKYDEDNENYYVDTAFLESE